MSIVGDVPIIIKEQKVMGGQLPVGRKDYHDQKQAHYKFPTSFIFNVKHYKGSSE